MKGFSEIAKPLIWLTELALSAAVPLFLFVYGAIWLRDRYGLGAWVLVLGILLGLTSAFSGLRSAFRAMGLMKKTGEKEGPERHSFNSHD